MLRPVGPSTPATLAPRYHLGYRPVPRWQVEAARAAGVQLATMRDWSIVVRQRVNGMLRAMVEHGATALASEWLADFEAAFCAVPVSWSSAVTVSVQAEAKDDIQRCAFLQERTTEAERLYEICLRREVAAKLAELRALDARRRA